MTIIFQRILNNQSGTSISIPLLPLQNLFLSCLFTNRYITCGTQFARTPKKTIRKVPFELSS